MIIEIFKEFIRSGKKDVRLEYVDLLRALFIVKEMTLIDKKNSGLNSKERKKNNGFEIPHTAKFDFIMKYIEDDKLYEVINAAFLKIENKNNDYKNKLALREKEMKEIKKIHMNL